MGSAKEKKKGGVDHFMNVDHSFMLALLPAKNGSYQRAAIIYETSAWSCTYDSVSFS